MKAKAKKKVAGQQHKRKRADAGPPSEADVGSVFELFNRQGLSAIIASDIEKVLPPVPRCADFQHLLHNVCMTS